MKNPSSGADRQKVSSIRFLPESSLRDTKFDDFKIRSQRLTDHSLNDFGQNTCQMDTSIIVRIVNRFLFIERHKTVESPESWP